MPKEFENGSAFNEVASMTIQQHFFDSPYGPFFGTLHLYRLTQMPVTGNFSSPLNRISNRWKSFLYSRNYWKLWSNICWPVKQQKHDSWLSSRDDLCLEADQIICAVKFYVIRTTCCTAFFLQSLPSRMVILSDLEYMIEYCLIVCRT